MATFLELVKDLARESGSLSGSTVTTVVATSGRTELLVGWVRKAYNNIQNSRRDWNWLRAEATSPLIIGSARYLPSSLGVTRFGSWVTDGDDWFRPMSIYETAKGVSDEGDIALVQYQWWYDRYGRGTQTNGRPTTYAISPAGEVVFGPAPDLDYTARFMYVKGPQELAANADVPEMPARFHEMITWEAQRLLMVHDGAYQESQWPAADFTRLRFELEREQLPQMSLGGDPIG